MAVSDYSRMRQALRRATNRARGAQKALARGDCRWALEQLRNAEFNLGAYGAHFDHMPSPRRQTRLDYAVRKAITKIADAANRSCVVAGGMR